MGKRLLNCSPKRVSLLYLNAHYGLAAPPFLISLTAYLLTSTILTPLDGYGSKASRLVFLLDLRVLKESLESFQSSTVYFPPVSASGQLIQPESINSHAPTGHPATLPIVFGWLHPFAVLIVFLRLPNDLTSPSQCSLRSIRQTQFAFFQGSTESSSFSGSVPPTTATSAPPF